MAQLAAELTPLASARHFLGAELRHWRCLRGMSLATLGRAVHVTGSLLGKVEKADRWPGADLIRRCDKALDGVAFCDTDVDVVFCSDGHWWTLDCGAVEDHAWCGLELDEHVVDCFVTE